MQEAVSSAELRRVLRRWPSGVTVVSVGDSLRGHGLTVSAFTSVSVDPPLTLVCINRASRANEYLGAKPAFVINILAAGQRSLSERFARADTGGSRLENVPCHAGVTGCPVLDDTAAALECTVERAIEAGDHYVYLGLVVATEQSTRDPLLYFDGSYQDVIYGRRYDAR